jgi:hypothetical protein
MRNLLWKVRAAAAAGAAMLAALLIGAAAARAAEWPGLDVLYGPPLPADVAPAYVVPAYPAGYYTAYYVYRPYQVVAAPPAAVVARPVPYAGRPPSPGEWPGLDVLYGPQARR